MPIKIKINEEWYDVTKFMSKHPGEGMVFLTDYNKQDVTEEFYKFHFTEEPEEMLIKAIERGNYEGIIHIKIKSQ